MPFDGQVVCTQMFIEDITNDFNQRKYAETIYEWLGLIEYSIDELCQVSYDKTVFIMTANDIEKVDNSLKCRPSRFKIVREFPNPTKEVIDKFVPEPWNNHFKDLNYDQLMRVAEFKNQGYSITKVFEMLSLELPKEVFNMAEQIYNNRIEKGINGTAEEDFLNACKQFDLINK